MNAKRIGPAKNELSMISGAGDEIRTRDIQLGRLSLYQLSYSRKIGIINRQTPSLKKQVLLLSTFQYLIYSRKPNFYPT